MCVTTPPHANLPRLPRPEGLRAWHRVKKALIYGDEAMRIARFVQEYPDIETGGDLFGYWTNSGAPVVSYVIGPGRGSAHRPASFYQNADWLHDVGVDLYDRHGLQHIGAWHSHHRLGLNQPSGGDIRTVVRAMAAKNWSTFVLMIATLDARPGSPVVQNYYLVNPDGDYKPLRLLLLDYRSPFRQGQDDPREESVQDPAANVRWRAGPSIRPGRAVPMPAGVSIGPEPNRTGSANRKDSSEGRTDQPAAREDDRGAALAQELKPPAVADTRAMRRPTRRWFSLPRCWSGVRSALPHRKGRERR